MRRPRLERLQESLYRRSIGGIRDLKDGRFKVVSAATTCDQQWPKQPNMEFLGLEPWVRCCTLTKSCGPVDRSEVDSLAPFKPSRPLHTGISTSMLDSSTFTMDAACTESAGPWAPACFTNVACMLKLCRIYM